MTQNRNYHLVAGGRAILCLRCGLTSWHPRDVQERYCGCCHVFHDDACEQGGAVGRCTITYDEIRFDVRQPDLTDVYVFVSGEGDCPMQALGWHHKAFSGRHTTRDIHALLFTSDEYDPVTWPRRSPPTPRSLTRGEAMVWVRVIQALAMPPCLPGAAEDELLRLVNSRIA